MSMSNSILDDVTELLGHADACGVRVERAGIMWDRFGRLIEELGAKVVYDRGCGFDTAIRVTVKVGGKEREVVAHPVWSTWE